MIKHLDQSMLKYGMTPGHQKRIVQDHTLIARQENTCSNGKQFYLCFGFSGCCAVDPCSATAGQTVTCPSDSTEPTTENSSTSHTQSFSQHASSSAGSATSLSEFSTTSTAPTATTGTSAASISTPTMTAKLVPDCASANDTIYTDSSDVDYRVLCGQDNTYTSFLTVVVIDGGYSGCFTSCSNSTACAGFSYQGFDGGNCYLKGRMPNEFYVHESNGQYVSAAKTDFTIGNTPVGSSPPHSEKSAGIGAIVGGVIGATAVLSLLIFAFILHRRREKRRSHEKWLATIKSIGGPIEARDWAHQDEDHKQEDVGYDAFAPFGGAYVTSSQQSPQRTRSSKWESRSSDVRTIIIGFYRGTHDFTRSMQRAASNATGRSQVLEAAQRKETLSRTSTNATQDLEAPQELETLPSTVYARPSRQKAHSYESEAVQEEADKTTELPDTSPSTLPSYRLSSTKSKPTQFRRTSALFSPSSAFSDSPTLGHDHPYLRNRLSNQNSGDKPTEALGRRPHILAWNNYDFNHAAAPTDKREEDVEMSPAMNISRPHPQPKLDSDQSEVSPDLSNSPPDAGYIVSPMHRFDEPKK